MDSDKQAELRRYDDRAMSRLAAAELAPPELDGVGSLPAYLRAPYLHYQAMAAELIRPQHSVLELGSGTGSHTLALASSGARVIATDISLHSLKYLKRRLDAQGVAVQTLVADMEALPFADNAFDVVACAGSLSYGDPARVDSEIRRVLRPGGCFICVDSLNHNPVYRVNRLIHCYRGNRTRSTLARMPNLARIKQISRMFLASKVRYFGALSFVMPVMVSVIGQERSSRFSDWFDHCVDIRRSAFKFVLVAQNLDKS
ncbi:MAG TPA: class I SAM-dependent methyltransferase [Burkholderiaceae bacterium]|jgi:ubiquinone/menaquinone biosynthesis C-methylase UbiE|nr:class I SAM-dependent methyltransferase [Burkholderiaceae bacterium]